MVMFFLNNEEEPNYKLSERNRRILRVIWALIIALFISTLGHPIGGGWKIWSHVVKNIDYYVDLVWCWVLVFLVLEYIYGITRYLDEKQPWKEGYYKRMLLMVILCIVGGMLFMEVFDHMYRQVTGRLLVRIHLKVFQIPMSLIIPIAYSLFCSVESLKDTYFDLLEKNKSKEKMPKEKSLEEKGGPVVDVEPASVVEDNPIIAIKDGEKIRLLDVPVKLIWHSDGINEIYYGVDAFYEDNHTLTGLYSYLDKQVYRKAGRNAVVHRDIIVGCKPRADKGMILELVEGYTQQIVVSKNDVEDFMAWFEAKGD